MNKKQTKKNKVLAKERNFDTKISEVEKDLNIDMGVSSNMKLGDYLISKGYKSLAAMLKS